MTGAPDSPPSAAARLRLTRLGAPALALVVFLVSLLVSGGIVRSQVVRQPDGLLGEKLAFFEEHKDEFDTVFVGSSRTYRQIVPEVFDAEMAARGQPTSSFNFGERGMTGFEVESVIDRILAMEPANLRWVFVAPEFVWPNLREELTATDRIVAWHDVDSTFAALEASAATNRGTTTERLRWAYRHMNSFLLNITSRGQAWDWLLSEGTAELPDYTPLSAAAPGGPGYASLDFSSETEEEGRAAVRRRNSLLSDAGRQRWTERQGRLVRLASREPPEPEQYELDYLDRMSTTVEDAGAVPVFLVLPAAQYQGWLTWAQQNEYVPRIFIFNDPDRYPAFYEIDAWWDQTHLDYEASIVFTELLADTVVAEIVAVR